MTVLLAALPLAARAEPVAGTVVDATTRAPVAGAPIAVTLSDRSAPVRATSDARGRFALDVPSAPVALTVTTARGAFALYDDYALAGSALRDHSANLQIALHRRLTVIEHYEARSRCRAFQPWQPYDVYEVVPGACGVPKR